MDRDDLDDRENLKRREKKLKQEKKMPFDKEMRLEAEQQQRLRGKEPDDLGLKPKNTDKAKASPHASLMPCIKCRKTHKKGQCKGY